MRFTDFLCLPIVLPVLIIVLLRGGAGRSITDVCPCMPT